MRLRVFGAATLAMTLAGGALAADPPAQYKPEDVVAAYGQRADAACPAGTVPADNGTCDPTVNTRGFSLASPGAGAAPPKRGAATRASGQTRMSSASVRPSAPLRPRGAPGDLLINFELGSANLTPQGRSNAESFASALKAPALSNARFALGGHTDASGSAQTNDALSQARAEAVKGFLVAQGVDAGRLDVQGYGSARPVDARHPKAAINRRVEALRLN